MNNEIDLNAQIEFSITNLAAKKDEISLFIDDLAQTFSSAISSPNVSSNANYRNDGTENYDISFRAYNPNKVKKEKLRDLLHKHGLVGWNLEGVFVKPD